MATRSTDAPTHALYPLSITASVPPSKAAIARRPTGRPGIRPTMIASKQASTCSPYMINTLRVRPGSCMASIATEAPTETRKNATVSSSRVRSSRSVSASCAAWRAACSSGLRMVPAPGPPGHRCSPGIGGEIEEL